MAQATRKGGEEKAGTVFHTLIVDDELLYAQAIVEELERRGITCDTAGSAADAIALAQSRAYQAILLDHKLPDDDGIRIIPVLLARQAGAVLIMMTAFETIPNAIQAIRQGAEDYLVKQPSVQPIVKRVLELQNREQVRRSVQGWREHKQEGLLGSSRSIEQVREKLRKAAQSPNTTVLISGESGVGKEVAALHLHRMTASETSPFVTVDCLALPENLVESILFGHEKGAFTGADGAKEGAFGEAGDGTIFLDEIGEMDVALQGKLLRVLESRSYQRVGSVQPRGVKARVIAATNRDLKEMIKQGRFRFDLYQRLSVFPVDIPPLCERREDVPILARHFLEFFCAKLGNPNRQLADDVLGFLAGYDYPGNVRELRNIVEQAVIMAEGASIGRQHLPDRLLAGPSGDAPGGRYAPGAPVDFIAGVDTLETFERKMIVHALEKTGGSRSEAAALLGISRHQMLRRIKKYNLDVPDKE
jgi:DNA-binding NtrC family response regulator